MMICDICGVELKEETIFELDDKNPETEGKSEDTCIPCLLHYLADCLVKERNIA